MATLQIKCFCNERCFGTLLISLVEIMACGLKTYELNIYVQSKALFGSVLFDNV